KYQVPPNAVILLGSSLPITDSSVAELIYIYNYDPKGRLIEKKVPGAQWEYIVYDNLNRVCFTQDGNQRSQSKWMFTKYDIQGRPVYAGYYSSAATRSSLQSTMDAVNYSAGRSWYEVDTVSTTGYSNIVLPTTGITVLSINYYDHYDFDRSTPNTNAPDYTFSNADSVGIPVLSKNTRGLSTGSKIVVFNSAGNPTSNWLTSVVFYDQYDRVVQTQSNNHLNSALQDINSISYKDLAGHIEKTKSKHVTPAATVTILQRYQYDDNWRTKAIYHSINGAPEQQLANYTYNILGQLVDKKLHVTGNNYLQSVDLRYNIRGWLRSINGAQLTTGTDNDDPTTSDLFGMDILYNSTDASLGNTPIYNGSVAAIKWKGPGIASGFSNQRSYKFTYDKGDRLKTATFQASQGTEWNKEVNTLNESLTYDANGNILSLTRNQNNKVLSGTTVTSAPEAIDNLSYSYTANTNRIEKVEDSANPSVAAQGDFKNGTTQTIEYSYTGDGSMMADKNKGIDSVKYNFLGKPYRIKFTDGRVVTYTYDAGGNKLKSTTVVNSVTTTNDYVGSFVYTNNALSFFNSPEGRVVKNSSSYEYQYAIADHQGNTRLLFTSAPQPQVIYTATMESENYAQETLTFQKLDNEIVSTAGNQTSGGNEVLRMNQTYPVGSAMSLKVYPGDVVDLEVYAYYESNSGYGTSNNTSANMITAIGGALSGLTTVVSEKGQITSGVNTAITAFGLGANQGDEVPAAYLNYILFDQQYKLITMGWTPVTSSSRFSKQRLAIDTLRIKEAGIMYVYLSYENQSNNYVFFDEMKVKHTRTNVVQYNEYYPFGMQTANSWTRVNAIGNSYLANGGTELNSSSNLYDLEYRNYDPALARMHQVDPMAAKYASLSPYNYSFNAPTVFTDVNGADPYEPNYWAEEAAQRKAAQMKGPAIESSGPNPFNKLIAPMNSAWGSGPWGSGSLSSFRDTGGFGRPVIIQIGNLVIDMSKVKDGLTLINFSGGNVQSILSFSDDDIKSVDRGTFEAITGINYNPVSNYTGGTRLAQSSSGEYVTFSSGVAMVAYTDVTLESYRANIKSQENSVLGFFKEIWNNTTFSAGVEGTVTLGWRNLAAEIHNVGGIDIKKDVTEIYKQSWISGERPNNDKGVVTRTSASWGVGVSLNTNITMEGGKRVVNESYGIGIWAIGLQGNFKNGRLQDVRFGLDSNVSLALGIGGELSGQAGFKYVNK
ncbi:MAG: RHS repeat-associated core domain-containing protein, partial [Cyclobacteriaceae bacterium]